MKTGFTNMSGFNLISYVTRGNKEIISVVMGGSSSVSRNSNMIKVLNKSLKLAKHEIPFPKSNPFVVQKKINLKYNSIKSEERRQSRFEIFSNRVDKILTIFP
jgi:D-alanyl-D-alanine carboxypeptidase